VQPTPRPRSTRRRSEILAPDWHGLAIEQLTFWWDTSFWPRLVGLTDDEYFWEPAPGCWNVRPYREGGFTIDWEHPAPDPPPVTTIAWRLAHLGSGVFAVRNADHFSGPPWDMSSREWPGSAADALAWVADGYARWIAGVGALDAARLSAPVGPSGGPYGHLPMAALVLHINREAIHHGAEICLMRDLWRAGLR
jgi:hypothetical protein